MKAPYVQPIPRTWFMRTRAYRLFMARELTSSFIAAYLIFLLVFLARLGQSAQAFELVLDQMRSPASCILHLLAWIAAMYHSVTWFNLTPQAMPVRMGEERMPDVLVAILGGYLPWFVISAVIFWGVFG